MTPHPLQSRADVQRIEQQPYAHFMPHTSVLAALQASAQRFADRPALCELASGDLHAPARVWTYRQFVDRVRRTAALFRALAGGDTPRVAMLLPPIEAAYLTLWGAEAAGVVCPINHLLQPDHIAALVRAADANILVALGPDDELDIWSRVPPLQAQCPGLRAVLVVGEVPGEVPGELPGYASFEQALAAQADDGVQPAPGDAGRLAALFHTGGTTGAPKLAQHTHGNQLHAAWGAARLYAMDEHDRILNGFPLFHVAGAFVFGLSALLSGAAVVLPTRLGLRHAGFMRQYWAFVEREGITLLAAVPTVIATLLAIEPGNTRLHRVRALLTGGSPLPTELANAFEQRFGKPVRNILGMTECAGVVSIEAFAAPRVAGSCGLPLPFVEVIAVDADGRPCAPGATGVLRLRGPNVGPGYTDAARNAGTFVDGGWLVTGDIGHVDAEGRVFVTGRAKDVIIRSSHNIDPQVIEEVLLQHPAVQMAAAVAEPDAHAGEMPVAFVSLKQGAVVAPDALMAFARQHLPERPAWPRRIEVLPAIPVTAIGKVYKPALRARACARAMAEVLAAAGLAGQVQAEVDEAADGLLLRLVPAPAADGAALRDQLARLMQPFALRWRIGA